MRAKPLLLFAELTPLTLLSVPVAVLGLYAVEYWGTGLVNLSYPFWWGLFHNHPPDVHLDPVPFLTPLRSNPFHITTYPGTLLVFAAGAASLLRSLT